MGKQSESNAVSVSFVRANHFIKVSPIRRGSFGFTALGHIVFLFWFGTIHLIVGVWQFSHANQLVLIVWLALPALDFA